MILWIGIYIPKVRLSETILFKIKAKSVNMWTSRFEVFGETGFACAWSGQVDYSLSNQWKY